MRGKRFATAAGGLTLRVVVCLALFWPTLRDLWYVQRLRADGSFLETALLDPTKCPPSALERYFETGHGKISLMKLYVNAAERWLSEGSEVYKANDFRQVVFLVHGDSVFTRVLSGSRNSSTLGSIKGQELLRSVNGRLAHLEGFTYQRNGPPTRRFVVMRAGKAAKKFQLYLRFDDGSMLLGIIGRSSPLMHRGEQNIAERDVEILNQGFALVVEQK